MSGMGDGYVGTAQDAVRIRKLEKQREAERRKIQELKDKSASAKGQPGLLQFGKSRAEILEHAFKKETVGLVTREEYVEKRINIRNKIEEEEKEKLQKQQQEEEELQLKKRKQRKPKGNSRLSFADDIENGSEEEDCENETLQSKRLRHGKLGKDPTVETSFLPDSGDEGAISVSGRQRNKLSVKGCRDSGFLSRSRFEVSLCSELVNFVQLHGNKILTESIFSCISDEPLQITYSYWDGAGHRRVIQVRKGDKIGEFLRSVQQQLAPEFREIRTTSVENLIYVKEDVIIPHQHSFYELIINKARGKSGPVMFDFKIRFYHLLCVHVCTGGKEGVVALVGCVFLLILTMVQLVAESSKKELFHFDVHEDVRTIADATIEKDESHAGKVVERHWYEKNKHIFPASRWEIYDPTKKWERYTIHGD